MAVYVFKNGKIEIRKNQQIARPRTPMPYRHGTMVGAEELEKPLETGKEDSKNNQRQQAA